MGEIVEQVQTVALQKEFIAARLWTHPPGQLQAPDT
jgi:hypothetical protein